MIDDDLCQAKYCLASMFVSHVSFFLVSVNNQFLLQSNTEFKFRSISLPSFCVTYFKPPTSSVEMLSK